MFKIAIRTMLNNYEYQYHALVILLLPISVRVRYYSAFRGVVYRLQIHVLHGGRNLSPGGNMSVCPGRHEVSGRPPCLTCLTRPLRHLPLDRMSDLANTLGEQRNDGKRATSDSRLQIACQNDDSLVETSRNYTTEGFTKDHVYSKNIVQSSPVGYALKP